eukprot:m.80763 g.80763  ORF g.80763 m.80763 type:complete len:1190 (-) comp12031_c0_seq1:97-3666(-)
MEEAVEFVRGHLGPRVLVLSTPEAEEMCAKCGLTCGQLLVPFSNVSFQDHNNTRRDITIHFKDISDFKVVSNPLAIRRTKAAVSYYNSACTSWTFPSDDAFHTPWFDAYRSQFLNLLRPSEHETITHPLMHIVFCSVKCDHPITAIAAANSSKIVKDTHAQYPFMESAAPVACVLLYDDDDTQENVDATLESIKDNFGSNRVFQLKMTLGSECDEGIRDMWVKAMPYLVDEVEQNLAATPTEEVVEEEEDVSTSTATTAIKNDPLSQMAKEAQEKQRQTTKLTQGLTPQHIRSLFGIVEAFASNALWPFINDTIQKLLEEIQAIKKSKSAFATARKWFGRSDTVTSPTKGGNKYEDDLRERKLADLLFFTKEYQQAYRYYNHVRRDNSGEKSYIHEASAIEMMATCQALVDTQKLDWKQDLTKAIHIYRARCRKPIHTMRSVFVLTAFLKAHKLYGLAGNAYLQEISDDVHLRSALFFEQAALHFAADGSLCRKADFKLVLAAFRFSRGGEHQHALRCYQHLEGKFASNKWLRINHHLHLQAAKAQHQLRETDECMDSLSLFLRTCPASNESHSEALSSFANLYLKMIAGKKESDENMQLPLPLLDHSSISVQLQVQALAHNSSVLEDLEETAANFLGVPQVKQLAVMNDSTKNTTKPVVVINEPIVIQFNVTNPTAITLHLLNITLDCEMTADDGSDIGSDCVELSTMDDVELGTGREMNMILSVTPLKTGQLNVKGIKYTIKVSDKLLLPGRQTFNVKGMRLNQSLQERLGKVYAKDYRLHFSIAPACPLVTAHIGALPSVSVAGQVLDVEVELKNVGKARVSDIVCVFPPSVKWPHVVQDGTSALFGKDNFIDLKSVACLAPGEKKKVTFRMQVTGARDVVDCWQLAYRGEHPPGALPYRLLKMCREIRVVQGPEVAVWMNTVTATSAILNMRFLSRRVNVHPLLGELRSSKWKFCDDQNVCIHTDVSKVPTVVTFQCERIGSDGKNSDEEIGSQKTEGTRVSTTSHSAKALSQSSCVKLVEDGEGSGETSFVKESDGFYLTWRADVKNRADFPIFGVCKMPISKGPPPTAIFEPASVLSSLSTATSSGVQTVSPMLIGTGFTPNEHVDVIVSQLFKTNINWLGKPMYKVRVDSNGKFKLTLTALLLSPYVVLDGVEMRRETDAQPVVVQKFILTEELINAQTAHS